MSQGATEKRYTRRQTACSVSACGVTFVVVVVGVVVLSIITLDAVPRDSWGGLSKSLGALRLFFTTGTRREKNLFLYKVFFERVVCVTCHKGA